MEAALRSNDGASLLGHGSAPITVKEQKVRISFRPLGSGSFLELVEPAPDNAFLLRLLRRGVNYYHLGYMCKNVNESVGALVANGAHELNRFQSEAFGGRLCVFLITTNGEIIELIESI